MAATDTATGRRSPARRAARVVAALAVVALVSTACAGDQDMLEPPVTIAVGTDVPGMHYQIEANRRTGLDVDFYRWIAATADPTFVPTETDVNVEDRVNVLRNDQARMVFSSFTITSQREAQVDFSAPYLQTFQGVLVRAGENRIRTRNDLSGRTVCAQTESTSIQELRRTPEIRVVEYVGLDQCVNALRRGAVDAVSTDQILLYGWAEQDPGLRVVPGLVFGAVGRYGIGLPPGPGTARCEQMNTWVRRFIDTGQWDTAFRNNFGTGVDPTPFKPETRTMRPCVDDTDGR